MVNMITNNSESDPREMMKEALPNWMQPLISNVVAKPYSGEKPRLRKLKHDIGITFICLAAGVVISVLAFSITYPVILLFGWGLTVYSERKLRLTVFHACGHHWVFAKKKWNFWLGELISVLTVSLDLKTYQNGHNKDHHSYRLLTPGDETYEYLINTIGFQLGMPVEEAWKHLRKTLLSPRFYLHQFLSGLNAAFLSPYPTHNLLAFGFWLPILVIVTLTNSWIAFFVAWLIPLFIFREASSLLRQCVEHRFLVTDAKRTSKTPNQMTTAIFCGEAPPQFDSSVSSMVRLVGWTQWWLLMTFYHLPSRVFILPGDSAGGHDLHHRYPRYRDWVNCIFERQKQVEAGEKYYHDWGLLNAINQTFISLSLQTSISDK